MSALKRARSLVLPSRDEMLRRDPTVSAFWNLNQDTLREAWEEWDGQETLPELSESLIDAKLRERVAAAWEDPSTEKSLVELFREVAPGVFQFQFFDPEKLSDLRKYLDAASEAQIPTRPPYGIVLNRKGFMLDQRSEGSLAAPRFQSFYKTVMDKYMRPLGRLLWPETTGYDSQTFGFSIQWQAPEKDASGGGSTDTNIRQHTDASSVTLNLNINLPGEEFTGALFCGSQNG